MMNIFRLGIKELWSLWRDPMMLVLITFTFSVAIYSAASAIPEALNHAAIAIVDEDDSPLSLRIRSAFSPPQFQHPERISLSDIDPGMDTGRYTFVVNIPPGLQADLLAGREASIQLNVDATRMSQAFSGTGYVEQIIQYEVAEFLRGYRAETTLPVSLVVRARFNPALDKGWFGALTELITQITLLSIILTGAALIREREHGTVEHLLVMPVTPGQIMVAKIWSMGLVVLGAAFLSMKFIVQGALQVPIEGSLTLFFAGTAIHLFATTSIGIYLATLARSMPQFGLLIVLTMLPLQMLSGGMTPRESMPSAVADIMLLAPTTHFVELGQAILFRGAGLGIVWPQFLALIIIGSVLFLLSLRRFRQAIVNMA